jgi:hypothetical protein
MSTEKKTKAAKAKTERAENPLSKRINTKVTLALTILAAEVNRFTKLMPRAGKQTETIGDALKQANKAVETVTALQTITKTLPPGFSAEKRVTAKQIEVGCKVILKADRRAKFVGVLDKVLVHEPLVVQKIGPGKTNPMLVLEKSKNETIMLARSNFELAPETAKTAAA